jgi:fragile X mental retardation protein
MEVEVYTKSSDTEHPGYFRATIKMMKGDFVVVEYLGWDNNYTEIVPIDQVRLKNPNAPLKKGSLVKKEFPVPDDVVELCVPPKIRVLFSYNGTSVLWQ